MTSTDAIEAARVFSGAMIVPLHYEGWTLTETRARINDAFIHEGIEHRIRWIESGARRKDLTDTG